MRIVLLLFVFVGALVCIISADCGCGETKEQERERQQDEKNHGCRSCNEITASTDDCPPLGYECYEEWPMVTNVLTVGDCTCLELRCVDKTTKIAVNGSIADKVRCSGSKWTDGKEKTTSAVCAKFCGLGVCKVTPSPAPALYVPLTVAGPAGENKCAVGSCANGAVALNADGTLNTDLIGVNTVTCSGDGLWRDGDEQYQFVVCKAGPPLCETACDPTPFVAGSLAPKSPTRTGCSFSCGANEALLRLDPITNRAISIVSASCEDSGQYRLNSTYTVAQIGCYTCDLPDGVFDETNTAVKAHVKGCVLTCPDGYRLQYYFKPTDAKIVSHIYRLLQGSTPVGFWYDSENAAELNSGFTFACLPNA